MTKKNDSLNSILIISGAFEPVPSPRSHRATGLVREFIKRGYDVTVITSVTHQEQYKMAQDIGFKLIDLGKRPRTLFINEYPLKKIKYIFNRLLRLFFEYPEIQFRYRLKEILNRSNVNVDLLISIAAPHPIHWGVADVLGKQKLAKIWLADCGDPYYLSNTDKIGKPFYFKYLEKKWCDLADYILVPKNEYRDRFIKEFDFKIKEVPQGFDIERDRSFCQNYIKNNVPTFLYAGTFIPNYRDPTQFLKYICDTDLDFNFHIYTKDKSFLAPFKNDRRIIVHDYIKRTDLLSEMSKMDFLVNFMYDPKFYAPSKMADYLIAERPILNIDYELDKDKIQAFLSGDYSKTWDMLDVSRFDIRHIADKFISLYESKL